MYLYVYCAGGLGIEVMDLARRINKVQKIWEHIGFIDDVRTEGEYYGTDLYHFSYAQNHFDHNSFEIVISNGEPFVRETLYKRLKSLKLRLATLADPVSIVSESAKLGEGSVIFANTYISSEAVVGNNTVFYPNCFVGHNSTIGENCIVTSSVNIAGNCTIENNTFIGLGSQIKQKTFIGSGNIIGAGSVVIRDISENMVSCGNPAKIIRENINHKVFL